MKYLHHWSFYICVALCLAGTGILAIIPFLDDPQHNATENIESALTRAVEEQKAFINRVSDNFSTGSTRILPGDQQKFPTFIFQDGKLVSWSDYHFVPQYATLSGDYNRKLVQTDQALFLSTRRLLQGRTSTLELYSLIIIERRYSLNNKYLQEGLNEMLFPKVQNQQIYVNLTAGVPIELDGEPIFFVEFNDSYKGYTQPLYKASLIILLLAIIFFYYWLLRFSFQFSIASFWRGFLILTMGLVGSRSLMLLADFPSFLADTELFSGIFYYYAEWWPSIGDFILNLLALGTIIYYIIERGNVFRQMRDQSSGLQTVFYQLGSLLLSLLTFQLLSWVIHHFGVYAQFPMDVSQVNTSKLMVAGYLVILFLLSLCHYVNFNIIRFIKVNRLHRGLQFWLAWAFAYLLFMLLFKESPLWWTTLIVHLVYSMLMLQFGWVYPNRSRKHTNYIYFFVTAVAGSIILSLAVYKAEERQDLIEKQKFANQLLIENDILGEYFLAEAMESIKNDNQLKSRFLNKRLITYNTAEQIRRNHLNNYFDKYDIDFQFFDAEGTNISPSNSNRSLQEFLTLFDLPTYGTDYDNIFFVNDESQSVANRYYAYIPIDRYDLRVGHLLISLQLKRYMPSSVYPELLVDQRFIFNPDIKFDYALFRANNLIYEFGDFNYLADFETQWINTVRLFDDGLESADYHHWAVKGAGERVFVISSPTYSNEAILTNFSFFFLLQMFVVILLAITYLLWYKQQSSLNFATRLQLFFALALFVPLFITVIAIFNALSRGHVEENRDIYEQRADNLSQNLVSDLAGFKNGILNKEQLNNVVAEASRYSQNDINLYDADGKLLASSQPTVFQSELISEYLNPQAFYQFISGEGESLIFSENIGDLNFTTSYHAVRSFEDGRLLGVLGIPVFQSASYLQSQQQDVFNSVINIFSLIFLISLIITNLIAAYISKPLNLIAQKMGNIKLEEENQPVQWDTDDEIGALIREYNRMLINLKKSRDALSKNEKEMAWREMARQVAHEIKNPLTPMKLTLQQLQRALQSKDNNLPPQVFSSIQSVVHQIDTLGEIANSFSAFAKMPIPQNQPMDLVKVVSNTAELFQEDCQLKMELANQPLWVFADPGLIRRIFNNLILNGIQSVPDNREATIAITMKNDTEKVLITVADNGSGIPEEYQNKIFFPNFSTKTSGSGLGLAIAKRGIENAGGHIWFETQKDHGTTFFIEFPLLNA